MADEKKDIEKTEPASSAAAQPTSAPAPRRLAIGANVVVSTILVIGLVVAANFLSWWLTDRYGLTADVTASKSFSFSSRTTLLLKKLEGPIRMTSLFSSDTKEQVSLERKRQVEDLLRQYQQVGGSNVEVEFIDPVAQPGELFALQLRITKTYSKEAEPYLAAIQNFMKFKVDLAKFVAAEKVRYEAVGRDKSVSPDMKQLMQNITTALEQTAGRLDELEAAIKVWTAGTLKTGAESEKGKGVAEDDKARSLGIPDYSKATSTIGATVETFAQFLDDVTRETSRQLQVDGLKVPENVRQDLQGSEARYAKMKKQLIEISKQLSQLKPLELEAVRNTLAADSVVIEAAGEVRVVGFDELYSLAPGASRMDSAAERRWNGEDAISSAILRLVSKEKVAAIFVQWGGAPIAESAGRFSELVNRLKRANFMVGNWDLHTPEPPKTPGATKTVYIVMMPEPTNPEMPMPPARPEDYKPLRDLMAAGGRAMVFTTDHYSLFMGRGFGPTKSEAPYLDILRGFGIGVKTDFMTVLSIPNEEGKAVVRPVLITKDYPSETDTASPQPIVKPLEGMTGCFVGPAPLEFARQLPAGVEVWPLVATPKRNDYWGEKNIMQIAQTGTGKFNEGEDIAAPYPIAAAATRTVIAPPMAAKDAATAKVAENKVAKLVVFGDDMFAGDELVRAQPILTNRGLQLLEYPANGEILVNSMLWLSDQEGMISVSPQAQQARRIGNIGKTASVIYRWGLPVGLPAFVIIIGILVYWVRIRVR